jgi:iron complex transport system ATP-binding protein
MSTDNKHSVLDVEDLSIGYSNKKNNIVLAEGVNFSILKGELIGLVGANGIGKSTLLRTLAGMQAELAGKININGKQLVEYNPIALATQLSVVLTEAPASRNLTVLELVSLGRQPYTNWMGSLSPEDIDAIQFALIATETQSLAERKCFELSDGQLQRVYIARALAQDTPLIILDEPTTHLDLYHRAFILKLLQDLAMNTGKTIIYSSHEIEQAIQLSDKLMVMTAGKVYVDTPQALTQDGIFDSLFPKELIEFDASNRQFKIKK